MTLDKEICKEIYKEICNLVDINRQGLMDDAADAVIYYADHDELEMAFEGLFIELLQMDSPRLSRPSGYYLKMAIQLDLDKETVFRDDFWENFYSFISSRSDFHAS